MKSVGTDACLSRGSWGRMAVVGLATCCGLLGLLSGRTAHADQPPPRVEPVEFDDATAPAEHPGLLPATLSILPGLVVHGSGHFAAGAKGTGYRLLAAEGIGLGLIAAGMVPIALTGASRRTIGPLISVTVSGVGLFSLSALADIYGSVVPLDARGRPATWRPDLRVESGYRYVSDPQFEYRHFAVAAGELRLDDWEIAPSAWLAADSDTNRLRFSIARTVYERRRSSLARVEASTEAVREGSRNASRPDATTAAIEVAGTHRHDGEFGFDAATAELAARARMDLMDFDPALRGAFASGSLGWAIQAMAYTAQGLDYGTDVAELLLARFGFGFYLGSARNLGEVEMYYDHRHDDFAAGLHMTGLGSGIIGHFGARAEMRILPEWSAAIDAQVGSAYVAGASAIYEYGGRP